jgi:membrane protein YdbS with pleckstrin-like domain
MASYVDSVLISGERVLHRGRVSLWPHAGKLILGILLLPLFGLGLVLLVWVYIIYKTTEIAITNKRIIAKSGFVSRNTIEINLPKIESLQVEQGVLGRMLDYGTVIVAGAGTPSLTFPGIAAPLLFRKYFMEATDGLHGRHGTG